MTPTKQYLKSLDACSDAIDWIGDRTLRQAWDECERGDWMLCLAEKQGVDLRKLTLAEVKFARLFQHLIKDPRSVDFLDVAERFGNGEATLEELETAANAADDDCAYDVVDYVAAAAADTVYTADAAAADAVYTADAAAADAANYYDTYTKSAKSADATANATAAGIETLRQCADICREILTEYMDFSGERK